MKLLEKKLIFGILYLLFLPNNYSEPPKEVINSCHQDKAINSTIKLTELSGLYSYDKEKVSNCSDNPDLDIIGVEINNRSFYQGHCGDKIYFLTGNRKFDLKKSINHSLDISIEPNGVLYISNWYLIQYGNKNYICMASALGPNGWAAAVGQYYVVENGFEENKPLRIYFIFLIKNLLLK